MTVRTILVSLCPVCGDAAVDGEARAHALALRLFGMDPGLAVAAMTADGICPRCGSVGHDAETLRAEWDAWSDSGDADEDDAEALDELGVDL